MEGVEAAVAVGVLTRVDMRRPQDRGRFLEVGVAVSGRRVHIRVQQFRGGEIRYFEIHRVWPVDGGHIDLQSIEGQADGLRTNPEEYVSRRRKAERRRGATELPPDAIRRRQIDRDVNVHLEEVESAVAIRILTGIRMWGRKVCRRFVEIQVAIGRRSVDVHVERPTFPRKVVLIATVADSKGQVHPIGPVGTGGIDRSSIIGQAQPVSSGFGACCARCVEAEHERCVVKPSFHVVEGIRVIGIRLTHIDENVDVHVEEVESAVAVRVLTRV